ncbi:STAS domain-containing protein [Planomonospora sp. ID67723]|uniref:STAS domain-containing protein n=1 Tax=Planomonospora sp. ID67723 TaxID=2738134 RepID=UPI0018C4472B|nr:STAS domain-containing protein [Planomonospora sp. ID67723]MBG0829987.1 STAS domain-containing protein [Planomonospora sp. ID67723]
MTLEISREHRNDFTIITIVGEVDKTEAAMLSAQIDEAFTATPPRLLFDLSSMNFIDSSGLRLLVQASSRAHRCGGSCALCCLNPVPRRIMRLTGLDAAFDLYPTLGAALTRGKPERFASAEF